MPNPTSPAAIVFGWCVANSFVASLALAGALALAAVVVRSIGDPITGRPRRTANIVLLLMAGFVVALAGGASLVRAGLWGYVLALVPGATIARHAIYMRLIRRRAMGSLVTPPAGIRNAADRRSLEVQDPDLALVFARARGMHDLDFAPDTLAVRFGIPALLTTFIGVAVFAVVTRDDVLPPGLQPMRLAARLGAAGAMVYVLLYLGQRAFRNDITTGAALWSAIVLAVGPLLSAVLSRIWKGSPDPTWPQEAFFFVAGMSPRHAASAATEAVKRLWMARSSPPPAPTRLQPLGQLRGMTEGIEDRLSEEGIADVQGMAMADPLKLFRATSFDKRQLLSWMDEALLISWLPDHWEGLQKIGISGAIDLMAHTALRRARLRKVLADASKLSAAEIEAIVLAGRTLREDAQLRLVWALYQFDQDGLDVPSEPADPSGFADGLGSWAVPGLGWLLGAAAQVGLALLASGGKVQIGYVAFPLACLAGSFAVCFAAFGPREREQTLSRLLVLATAIVLGATAYLTRHRWFPLLSAEVPVRQWLMLGASICGAIFLLKCLLSRVGGRLEIEFPNGVPSECELWIDGRSVPISRNGPPKASCWIPGRSVAVVARATGWEQRRWVDARGRGEISMSLPLPGVAVVQIEPLHALPSRCWVDGVARDLGPLVLRPRSVPYRITVESEGFELGGVDVQMKSAEVVAAPVRLSPAPTAKTRSPKESIKTETEGGEHRPG